MANAGVNQTNAVNVTIAVDAVGGDFAPRAVLDGVAVAVASDPNLKVLLVGPADVVEPFAASHLGSVEAVVATEVIEFNEHPAQAVRAKKDSSIVVGCQLVRDGRADGFFSAGSTGAAMAAATLVIGRIRGVSRPAIATTIPSGDGWTVLLDCGANADVKLDNYVQFAHMGAAYARTALGVASPTVALLNIGEEETKGSEAAQAAHALLAAQVPNFIGNAEGRDLVSGFADVVVTDGFTGNVALKLLEGTSKQLLGKVKAAMTSSPLAKIASLVLVGKLRALRDQLDPDSQGGAPLLGVNGVTIIGHGSSSAAAVGAALRVGARAVRNDLTGAIAAAIAPATPDADGAGRDA